MEIDKFTGVFFCKALWLDNTIPAIEKMVLMEIDALDGEDGCYAGNEHFSEMFGVTERQIQRYIADLKEKGCISFESFDGRKRVLRSNIKTMYRYDKNVISETSGTSLLNSQKCHSAIPIIEKRINRENVENLKYLPFSITLKERILKLKPEAIIKESQINDWCNDFRLMVEQDHRTEQQMYDKIDAVFSDDFWSGVIRSASKLRLRWNEGKLPSVVQLAHDEPEEFIDEPRSYDMPQI